MSLCRQTSSAVAEMGDRGHNRHRPKRWGLLCPFHAELGPRLIQCGLGRGLFPYQVASSSIQLFGHNGHWTKIGGLCPFRGGETGSPSKVAWAKAYLHTKWHIDASSRLATIKMRRKFGGSAHLFWGRGAGSPSSTMWPGPRPTSMPSAILIHPAVWPL